MVALPINWNPLKLAQTCGATIRAAAYELNAFPSLARQLAESRRSGIEKTRAAQLLDTWQLVQTV